MKRLLTVMLAFMLFFSLVLPAFADAAGPFYTVIKAAVSKKDGADIYDWDYETGEERFGPTGKKIPYGATLELSWENYVDGELYYNVTYLPDGADEDDELWGYVKAADLDMDLSPVKPEEKNAYETPEHYVVINEDGAKMYEGPGRAYKEIKTLKKGTEVESLYYDGCEPGAYPTWSYIKDDGDEGWVQTGQYFDSLDFGRLVKYKEDTPAPAGKIKVLRDSKLYNTPKTYDDDAKVIATIPAGTELTYDVYYSQFGTSMMINTEYGGKSGWLETDNYYPKAAFALNYLDGYLLTDSVKRLLEDDNLTPGEQVSETEPYQILPFDMCYARPLEEVADEEEMYEVPYEIYYRVNVDGENYWLVYGSELGGDLIMYYGGSRYINRGGDMTVYSQPDSFEEIGAIPQGGKFVNLFYLDKNDYIDEDFVYDPENEWNYIVYNGLCGWVHIGYENCEPEPTAEMLIADPMNPVETQEKEDTGEEEIEGFFEQLFGLGDDGSGEPDSVDGGDPGNVGNNPRKAIIKALASAGAISALAVFGIVRAKKKKPE